MPTLWRNDVRSARGRPTAESRKSNYWTSKDATPIATQWLARKCAGATRPSEVANRMDPLSEKAATDDSTSRPSSLTTIRRDVVFPLRTHPLLYAHAHNHVHTSSFIRIFASPFEYTCTETHSGHLADACKTLTCLSNKTKRPAPSSGFGSWVGVRHFPTTLCEHEFMNLSVVGHKRNGRSRCAHCEIACNKASTTAATYCLAPAYARLGKLPNNPSPTCSAADGGEFFVRRRHFRSRPTRHSRECQCRSPSGGHDLSNVW